MNNDDTSAAVTASFPIVGIGASAGGMVDLEQFLSYVPPRSGRSMVVAHLFETVRNRPAPSPGARAGAGGWPWGWGWFQE